MRKIGFRRGLLAATVLAVAPLLHVWPVAAQEKEGPVVPRRGALADVVYFVTPDSPLPNSPNQEQFIDDLARATTLVAAKEETSAWYVLNGLLEMEEIAAPARHPARAIVLMRIAVVEQSMGREAEAAQHLVEAGDVMRVAGRVTVEFRIQTIWTIASRLERLKRVDDAAVLLKAAYEFADGLPEESISLETFTPAVRAGRRGSIVPRTPGASPLEFNHEMRDEALDRYIEVLERRGDWNAAESMSHRRIANAADGLDRAAALGALAQVQVKANAPQQALDTLARAFDILDVRRETPGRSHVWLTLQATRAAALDLQSRRDEAEALVGTIIQSPGGEGDAENAARLAEFGSVLSKLGATSLSRRAEQAASDLRRGDDDHRDMKTLVEAIAATLLRSQQLSPATRALMGYPSSADKTGVARPNPLLEQTLTKAEEEVKRGDIRAAIARVRPFASQCEMGVVDKPLSPQAMLTSLLIADGALADAEAVARAWVACVSTMPDPSASVIARARSELAHVLAKTGRQLAAVMEYSRALMTLNAVEVVYEEKDRGPDVEISYSLATRTSQSGSGVKSPELAYDVATDLRLVDATLDGFDIPTFAGAIKRDMARKFFGENSIEFAESSALAAQSVIGMGQTEPGRTYLRQARAFLDNVATAPEAGKKSNMVIVPGGSIAGTNREQRFVFFLPSRDGSSQDDIVRLRLLVVGGFVLLGERKDALTVLAPVRQALGRLDRSSDLYKSAVLTMAFVDLSSDDAAVVLAAARQIRSAAPKTQNTSRAQDVDVLWRTLSRVASARVADAAFRLAKDRPQDEAALFAEAFEAAQSSEPFMVASAIRRSNARLLARTAHAEAEWDAWVEAGTRVDAANAVTMMDSVTPWMEELASSSMLAASVNVMGQMGAVDDRIRGIDRNAALTAYDTAQAALEAKMPELFNVLRPAPTPLSALMAGPNGAGLLRDDEALIVIVEPKVGQEAGSGFVFAVTRDRFAWSRIEMPGAMFQARLLRLQASLRNRTLLAESRDRFGETAVVSAHELYKALFGAGQVSELLATKRTWLIAPQGRLVGLPFTILPTTEPDHTGNGTADGSQEGIPWLGLDRALAIVPSVSSLEGQRARGRTREASTTAFFGIGNPEFGGNTSRLKPNDQTNAFTSTRTSDVARMLASLAPLPWAEREVSAMAEELRADSNSYLTGRSASESEFRRRYATGDITKADVLLFATHGLLAGGALDEPALALSPPLLRDLPIDDSKDDGLLGVGEITALQLSARWVILSACNTASAEKENGPALSGLARAFLFAGARSLLVSYWAVNDAAAAALTTRTIAIERQGHSGPEALRRAMLELYEKNPDANPSLWAPFMVIGSE